MDIRQIGGIVFFVGAAAIIIGAVTAYTPLLVIALILIFIGLLPEIVNSTVRSDVDENEI